MFDFLKKKLFSPVNEQDSGGTPERKKQPIDHFVSGIKLFNEYGGTKIDIDLSKGLNETTLSEVIAKMDPILLETFGEAQASNIKRVPHEHSLNGVVEFNLKDPEKMRLYHIALGYVRARTALQDMYEKQLTQELPEEQQPPSPEPKNDIEKQTEATPKSLEEKVKNEQEQLITISKKLVPIIIDQAKNDSTVEVVRPFLQAFIQEVQAIQQGHFDNLEQANAALDALMEQMHFPSANKGILHKHALDINEGEGEQGIWAAVYQYQFRRGARELQNLLENEETPGSSS